MIIARNEVQQRLQEFLTAEDHDHLALITDLTWAATIVHEFGFWCQSDEERVSNKEKLLKILRTVVEAKREAGLPSHLEECNYPFLITVADAPGIEDLDALCEMFHDLTSREDPVQVEILLKWLDEAWGDGIQQRRVASMEIEGGIKNMTGITGDFAAWLAMHGDDEGLLPP